jgi:hypothetical protein
VRRLALLAGLLAALVVAVEPRAQALPPGAGECRVAVERALAAAARVSRADPESVRSEPATEAVLGDVCPEFAAALAASRWSETLASGPPAELPLTAVQGFFRLAERYAAEAGTPAPDPAALDAIVARLQPFELPPERSLWDRAVARLEEWLGGLAPKGRNRLIDWLRGFSLPVPWRRALVYGVGALLVLTVVAVLGNELRHSGLFGRRRRRARPRRGPGGGAPPGPAAHSLEDVRAAPAARQPVLLLGLVLECLGRRDPGLIRPSFTHREIAAAGRSLGGAPAASLGAIAASAERATYGDRAPDAAELERLIDSGRSLLAFVERPADGAA